MMTTTMTDDDVTAEQQAAINDEYANSLTARIAAIHAVLAHRQLGIAVDVNPRTKIRYATIEEQRLRETIKRETKELQKQRETEAAKTARMMALGIKTYKDNDDKDDDEENTTEEYTKDTTNPSPNGKSKQTRFNIRSPDSVSVSSSGSSSSSSSSSGTGSGSDSDSEDIDGTVSSYSSTSSSSSGDESQRKAVADKETAKEKRKASIRKGKKEVKVSKAQKGPKGLLAHYALFEGDAKLGAHVAVGESALQMHDRKNHSSHTVAGTGALSSSSTGKNRPPLKRGESGVFDFTAVTEPLEETVTASPVTQKRKGLFELTKGKSFRHTSSSHKLVPSSSSTAVSFPSSSSPKHGGIIPGPLTRQGSSNRSLPLLSPLNPNAGSGNHGGGSGGGIGPLVRAGSTRTLSTVASSESSTTTDTSSPHHHKHHHHKHHHHKHHHHHHKNPPSAAALGDSSAIKALFVPGGAEVELARKTKAIALESRLRRLAAEELVINTVDGIRFDPLKTSLATVQESALKIVNSGTTSTEKSGSSSSSNSSNDGTETLASSSPDTELSPPENNSSSSTENTSANTSSTDKPSLHQNPSFPELAQHISKIMRWVACRIHISYDPRKFAYYFASPVAMDIVTDCFWLVHTRMFAEKNRQKEARKEAKRKLAELLANGRKSGGGTGGAHHGGDEEDDEEEEEAALSVGTVLMPSAETLLATEVLVESLATQNYMLMKAVRTNKYLFAQFFPYAVADAVYHAFVFLLPGSKASYTNLFRLGVYTEITRLLSGVELAPTTVARMADSLFPDESTIARFKQQGGTQASSNGGKDSPSRSPSRGGSGAVSSGDESTASKREKHHESDRKAQNMARALGFRSTFELFKTTTPTDRAYLGLDVTARVEILRRLDRTTIIPTSAFLVTGTSVPPASVTATGSVTAFISPPSNSHKRMYDHGNGHTAQTLSHPEQFQDRVQKLQEGIPTVPPVLTVPDTNGRNSKPLPSSTILMSPVRVGHTVAPKKYVTVRTTTGEFTRVLHHPVPPSNVTSLPSPYNPSSSSPILPQHSVMDNLVNEHYNFPSHGTDPLVYKTKKLAKLPYKPPTLASSHLQSFLMHPKAWEATVGLVAGVAGDPTLLAAEPTVETEIDNDEVRRAKILGLPLHRSGSASPHTGSTPTRHVSPPTGSTIDANAFTGVDDGVSSSATPSPNTTNRSSPTVTSVTTSRLSTADPSSSPSPSPSRTVTRTSTAFSHNTDGRHSPEMIAQNKAIMENAALIAKARVAIRDQIHIAEQTAVAKGTNAVSAAVQAAVRALNDTTKNLSPVVQRNRLLPPLESLTMLQPGNTDQTNPSFASSVPDDANRDTKTRTYDPLSTVTVGTASLFSPIKPEMDLYTDSLITDMGNDDGLASIAGIGTLPSVNPDLAYRMLLARSKARPLMVPYVTTSTSTLLQRALPHVKANRVGGHRAMHRTVPVPWSRTGGVDTFRSYHGHMAGSTETGGIITDIDQARKNNTAKKKKTYDDDDNEKDPNEDLGGQLKDAAAHVNIGVTTTAASIKATIAAVQAESLRARASIVKETRHQKEQMMHAGRGTIARAAQEIRMNRLRNRQAKLNDMSRPSDTHLLRGLEGGGDEGTTTEPMTENGGKKKKDNRTITYDRSDPGMNGASMVYTNITIPPVGSSSSINTNTVNPNASSANLGGSSKSLKMEPTKGTTKDNNTANKYTNSAVLQLNLMSVANFARSSGNFDGEPLAFGNPNKKAALASLATTTTNIPSAIDLANPRGPRPNPEALVTAKGIGSVIEPLQNLPKDGISGMLQVYGGVVQGSTLAVTSELLKNIRAPETMGPTK